MQLNQPLNREQLECIIEGAAFLGSGGGGPLSLARPLIDYMANQSLWPTVASFDQIKTGPVGTVAGIGSPAAASGGDMGFTRAPVRMVRLMEQLTGSSFRCLIPGETGPMNSLIPLLAGAQRGIPILDADGAGRAMSTLGMSTFNETAPVHPFVIGNEASEGETPITAQLTLNDPSQADAMSRSIVSSPAFDSAGAFSTWPSTVEALNKVVVHGSLSLCFSIGTILRQSQAAGIDPLPALAEQPELKPRLRVLFSGPITGVDVDTTGGFDRMTVRLGKKPSQLTIMGLNENMIAWSDSASSPVCMGPDSICYVTTDGHAFSNASVEDIMKQGKTVHVIGLVADQALKKPSILRAYATVLAQLGYAGCYQPLSAEQGA
ncbi:MAG: DUF917 domain-containing protein [Natronospirillum sp.]|uniref:S-methyl thiohydantoin desulfurase domain-containing protein n=1 Tax=Natronospirillum sp. TaxID=2812955 RepID=UPI0025EB139A|nr:DUF917 family protein [Natronospirillum sp.]MCH8550513.1 DUF917 domain-containing protein [Natronospirillum sp.]